MRLLPSILLASGLLSTVCLSAAAPAGGSEAVDTAGHAVADATATPATTNSLIDGKTADERLGAFLHYCGTVAPPKTQEARVALAYVAARIYTGNDVASSIGKWQEIAVSVYENSKACLEANPKNSHARDPFEKHALIHAYVICRDKADIPEAIVLSTRRYVEFYKHRDWVGYGALNYRLMNDGAGFIAAELWSDLKDADGLDSEGIKAATKQRLLGYFDDIARNNTGEYGAPTYLGIDFSAIKLLADFARDAEVKKRAALTLDSMILHVACAWNSGYYITPASRAKYWGSSITCPEAMDTTAAIGWFYFGGLRPVDPAHMNPGGAFWFSIRKGYSPPDIFTSIANNRDTAFTHRGSVWEKIRFTIYHAPGYSLASEWELLNAPSNGHYKESRRQMLKWVSPKPYSTFTPLQDNPRRPYRLNENIANAFGYGENPFAQCLQDGGTLIGISSVPEDYPYWKMYAPFTTDGAILKRMEKDGWVFCHGGSVLFAFRYLQPSYWGAPHEKENCDILKSDNRKNGWVLETAPVKSFAGGGVEIELGRFAQAVLDKSRLDSSGIDAEIPRFTYKSIGGHLMDITYRAHKQAYTDQHKIDGGPVDYMAFPLFGNPWVTQPLGGDSLKLQFNHNTLTYDFKDWTRTAGTR